MKITFIGLSFLFIEMKELCEARAKLGLSFLFIETKELCEARAKLEMSSNVQIYPGKTDDRPPSQTCQAGE